MTTLIKKAVIAFAGRDGAGKSTLAKAVQEYFHKKGIPCRTLPFANELRLELNQVLRDNSVNLWEKPTPEWMRDLLKGWGGYKRSKNLNYWVEKWWEGVQNPDPSLSEIILVDDLRYVNEARFVKYLNGLIFFLDYRLPLKMGYELPAVKKIADQRLVITADRQDPGLLAKQVVLLAQEYQERVGVKFGCWPEKFQPSYAARQPFAAQGEPELSPESVPEPPSPSPAPAGVEELAAGLPPAVEPSAPEEPVADLAQKRS